jgi:hypothetical protein
MPAWRDRLVGRNAEAAGSADHQEASSSSLSVLPGEPGVKPDRLFVVAVAHQRRRPQYWTGKVP